MVVCEVEECKEKAKYGVKQFQASKCKEHKEKGMVAGSKYYCKHNKQKSQCRECGGSAFCKHDKWKNICRKCGGSSFCKHDKLKSQCKECGGSSFCKHEIRKSRCKECGGSELCKHEIQKSRCKECGGSELCKHEIRKSRCRECGGSAFCKHDKQKNQCKDCGSFSFCKHGIRKSRCISCKGKAICSHKNIKNQCLKCVLSEKCKHGLSKISCDICPCYFCIHKLQKYYCSNCTPESNNLCIRRYGTDPILTKDNSRRCEKTKQKKYDSYCTTCFIELFPDDLRTKTAYVTIKENIVRDYLTLEFSDMFTHNKRVSTIGVTSSRYIDFQTEVGDYILCVEVDEYQHLRYDQDDEEERISQIYDHFNKNMIIIRFNPDNYTVNEILMKTPINERLSALDTKISEIILFVKNGGTYDTWLTEIKMFFDDVKKTKKKKPKKKCVGMTRNDNPCKKAAQKDRDYCRYH